MLGTGLAIPEVAARGRRAPAVGFDFIAGLLPAGAVLTRASAAKRGNAAGPLSDAAADVARFDYDPVGHTLRGLLVEAATTNTLPWSEQFDNAAGWTPLNGTVTANAATGPDGGTTADLFTPSTANVAHRLLPAASSFTAGVAYALSFYLKAAGCRYGSIRLPGGPFTAGNRFAVFDLQTGAVNSASAGVAATIEPASAGFYRCQLVATPAVTASGQATVAISQSGLVDATEAFAGDGVGGMLVWGAQLESGAVASSYVATTAASASRAADVLSLDWGGRGVTDGAITVRYGFDDGGTQDMAATISGGVAVVPTNLNRTRLRRAERV